MSVAIVEHRTLREPGPPRPSGGNSLHQVWFTDDFHHALNRCAEVQRTHADGEGPPFFARLRDPLGSRKEDGRRCHRKKDYDGTAEFPMRPRGLLVGRATHGSRVQGLSWSPA